MGAFLTWVPDGGGDAKSLYFDVCTEEDKDFSSTVTEHPVEDGVNVADHVKKELDKLSIEVFVSNAPVYDFNARGSGVQSVPIPLQKFKPPLAPTPGAVFSAIGSAISGLFSGDTQYSANVMKFGSEFNAIEDTETKLKKLKDDVQLVTVVTAGGVYDDMFLEHIAVQRNAGSGDGATFRLEFREVRKVQVSLVNAPKPTEPRGQTMKPKGVQTGKTPKSPDQMKSWAKSGLDNLPAFFTKLTGAGQ